VTILLHVLVAALYASATWARWSSSNARVVTTLGPAAQLLLALALALHAFVIVRAIVRDDGLDLSFVNALSLVAGLAALAAWLTGVLRTLPGVGVVILPVAAFCVLLSALAAAPHRVSFAGEPWAAAHIAVALCAYALFVVVDLAAGALAFALERKEDWKLLLWLPLQRFAYRQLMYYVVVKSTIAALRGTRVGWGKLERKATVT